MARVGLAQKLVAAFLLALAPAAAAQAPAPLQGNTIAPHPLTAYAPVTDQMLRQPNPADWLMMRGNYEGYGFSTLKQIDKGNVKGLQLVWARTMAPGVNEATPIVHDGVMFLGNPDDVIQAIDAASGELLWEYRRTLPPVAAFKGNFWGQRKRSIFLYQDKVFTMTRDNFPATAAA